MDNGEPTCNECHGKMTEKIYNEGGKGIKCRIGFHIIQNGTKYYLCDCVESACLDCFFSDHYNRLNNSDDDTNNNDDDYTPTSFFERNVNNNKNASYSLRTRSKLTQNNTNEDDNNSNTDRDEYDEDSDDNSSNEDYSDIEDSTNQAIIAKNEKGLKLSQAAQKALDQKALNRNEYYYRHNDEQRVKGPWSNKEDKVFMKRVKECGVNYHWGDFSRSIAGRCGYACSNHWRQMIKDGKVSDPNYIKQNNGKLHFKKRKLIKHDCMEYQRYAFTVNKDPTNTFAPLPATHPNRPDEDIIKQNEEYIPPKEKHKNKKKKTKIHNKEPNDMHMDCSNSDGCSCDDNVNNYNALQIDQQNVDIKSDNGQSVNAELKEDIDGNVDNQSDQDDDSAIEILDNNNFNGNNNNNNKKRKSPSPIQAPNPKKRKINPKKVPIWVAVEKEWKEMERKHQNELNEIKQKQKEQQKRYHQLNILHDQQNQTINRLKEQNQDLLKQNKQIVQLKQDNYNLSQQNEEQQIELDKLNKLVDDKTNEIERLESDQATNDNFVQQLLNSYKSRNKLYINSINSS